MRRRHACLLACRVHVTVRMHSGGGGGRGTRIMETPPSSSSGYLQHIPLSLRSSAGGKSPSSWSHHLQLFSAALQSRPPRPAPGPGVVATATQKCLVWARPPLPSRPSLLIGCSFFGCCTCYLSRSIVCPHSFQKAIAAVVHCALVVRRA